MYSGVVTRIPYGKMWYYFIKKHLNKKVALWWIYIRWYEILGRIMKINSAKLILEFFATYLFFDYAHSNFSSIKESSYKIQQRGEGEVEPDKTNLSGLNGLNDECQVGKAHHFSPFVLVVFGVEEGVGPQDTLGQLSWFWTWSQDLGTKEI